jgi:hypothetical protein
MNKARLIADGRYNKDQVLTMRDKMRVSYTIKIMRQKAYANGKEMMQGIGKRDTSSNLLGIMVYSVANVYVIPLIKQKRLFKALYKRNINRS